MPHLACARTELRGGEDWEHIDHSFRSAQSVDLHQGWRSTPEPRFRPATVRTACNDRSLFVYATLTDDDIFNPVTAFNVPAFDDGDVLEIFLKPLDADDYHEFHVNPNNQQFRLHIPSAESFHAQRITGGIPPAWFNPNPVLDSRVWIEPERTQWRVLATITLNQITNDDEWLFSCSRYDHTRGESTPVLSSTSSHPEIDFHRQQDWHRLTFVR